MKRIISLACVLAVGACTTVSAIINPVSPAEIATLEEGVIIADKLALNYTGLPPCPVVSGVCSDVATKMAIKGYAQKAHDAVKTLEVSSTMGAPAALVAAQAALAALQGSIPSVTTAN